MKTTTGSVALSENEPSRSRRPNLVPVILSVVAGLGHLALGRSRRAYFLFLGATLGWNLLLLTRLVPVTPLGTWSEGLGWILGGGLTLYAIADTFRVAVYARLPSVSKRRCQHLADARVAADSRDFHRGREILDAVLDIDPSDPEARLLLARIERETGHLDRARHHAKKALRAASSRAHRTEVEGEFLRIDEARRGR